MGLFKLLGRIVSLPVRTVEATVRIPADVLDSDDLKDVADELDGLADDIEDACDH
jgi:hypothetical protein